MSQRKKKDENQLSLFEMAESLTISVNIINKQENNNSTIAAKVNKQEKCGFLYIVEDDCVQPVLTKPGFTEHKDLNQRMRGDINRGSNLNTLAVMPVPTVKMEKFFHRWLRKKGIKPSKKPVGRPPGEWYPGKENGYQILGYLHRLPEIYLKKAKLTNEEKADIQKMIDDDYFRIVFFDEITSSVTTNETTQKANGKAKPKKIEEDSFFMMPWQVKQIPKSSEEYIQHKKCESQMRKEAQEKRAALSPAAIHKATQIELERLKMERLIGSHTYDEVAKEFNIFPRTFKEYVSGKRKPGKGVVATQYGLLLEKYYLNTDVNLWYIRDDYRLPYNLNNPED
jgi:hypothetical protein